MRTGGYELDVCRESYTGSGETEEDGRRPRKTEEGRRRPKKAEEGGGLASGRPRPERGSRGFASSIGAPHSSDRRTCTIPDKATVRPRGGVAPSAGRPHCEKGVSHDDSGADELGAAVRLTAALPRGTRSMARGHTAARGGPLLRRRGRARAGRGGTPRCDVHLPWNHGLAPPGRKGSGSDRSGERVARYVRLGRAVRESGSPGSWGRVTRFAAVSRVVPGGSCIGRAPRSDGQWRWGTCPVRATKTGTKSQARISRV